MIFIFLQIIIYKNIKTNTLPLTIFLQGIQRILKFTIHSSNMNNELWITNELMMNYEWMNDEWMRMMN